MCLVIVIILFYFDKYKDFSSFGKWKLFLHIPLSEIIVLEIFPKYSRSVIIREIYIYHGGIKLKKWVCKVCGYEYDPATGDPENDVAPGTAFEDLPEDWVCPVCGAGKDEFEEI